MRNETIPSAETIMHGIPAATGYAEGICVYIPSEKKMSEKTGDFTSEEFEIESYLRAVEAILAHFENLRRTATDSGDELTARLMEACCEMAGDEELKKDVVALIRQERISATEATRRVFDDILDDMKTIEDEYARQRTDDLRSVRDRLIRAISGEPIEYSLDIRFGVKPAIIKSFSKPKGEAIRNLQNVLIENGIRISENMNNFIDFSAVGSIQKGIRSIHKFGDFLPEKGGYGSTKKYNRTLRKKNKQRLINDPVKMEAITQIELSKALNGAKLSKLINQKSNE